ncbi:MAG: 30S ribosome-binding factor RbfA [Deltaproteobacteria bacterium]
MSRSSSGRRPERVADVIKEEIASMLVYGEIKDPRIGFVTITEVKMTPDLREAKVYFSRIGADSEKAESLEGLSHAGPFIRRNLAKRLKMRHIPELSFIYDSSLDYYERIDKVIKDIKKGGE